MITADTFRGIQFRQKRHGYDPSEVDAFLEQAAQHVEAAQAEAIEVRSRPVVNNTVTLPMDDGTLQKTLLLAQRTADLAVQEAHVTAAGIVADAQRKADDLTVTAQKEAQALRASTLADSQAELAKIEAKRVDVQAKVDLLTRWANDHRTHLAKTLEAVQVMFSESNFNPPPAIPPAPQP